MKRIQVPPVLFYFMVGLFFVFHYSFSQETAAQLFEKALYLEEAQGELQQAIDLYQQIFKQYPENRGVAAKSLLHMGMCYEKLGQKEARQAYQKLINEFSEQLSEVEVARHRLSELTETTNNRKPNFRKILIPTKLPMHGSGMLSPDGQKLAFISEGSLWLVAVHGKSNPDITGTPVRLTEPMHAWDNANVSIVWSSDGNWIGFRVAVPRADQNAEEELYILPVEGGIPKRLPITWKDSAGDLYTLRYALSGQAKSLYFADGSRAEELCIYRMNTVSGEKQPVTTPITRVPALSPDGSKIAYIKIHLGSDGIHESQQVWMKSLEGDKPVLVCEVSGKNWLASPIWSPAGNEIAFLSSAGRGGNRYHQIWVVALSATGKPSSPTKIELPGQTAHLLAGWTRDNKIGILIPAERREHLYTVPASGGKATQLTTAYTYMPVWAPDNKHIYFDGTHGGKYAGLEYVAAEGGKVIRIPVLPENLQPVYPSELAISNDGSKLLFAGFYRYGEAEPAGHLFTVPIEGGGVTPINIGNIYSAGRPVSPAWSADETQIAFLADEEVKPDHNVYNIYVMPATGGEPRKITNPDDQVSLGPIAWSPDGKWIAFFCYDNTLRLIPANGGSSRILAAEVGGGLYWSGISWSPDGKQIAYTAGGDLQVISLDRGEPKRIQTGLEARHLKIDWSADGSRIAFTASQGGESELWLMENFLH